MDEQTTDTKRRRPLGRLGLAIGLAGGMILGSAGSAVAIHQFTDVPDANAFHDDIDWLVDNNIAAGFPDGTYKPGAAVTRQSMAAFMRRLAGQKPGVAPSVNALTLNGLTKAQVGEQYWAVVNTDGTLARSNATTASFAFGDGAYAVAFSRSVVACSFTASLGNSGSEGSGPIGQVAVVGLNDAPNGVYVTTRDSAGVATDASFHLQVMC